MKILRKITVIAGVSGAIALVAVILLHFLIDSYGSQFIVADIDKIPDKRIVLVLGARVSGDNMSDMLSDRASTALDLYNANKAEKILVSGDHSQKYYDEVAPVKDYLLENGVKEEDIFLDYAGLDTYDSVYRAREIYGVRSMLIVSQDFHLPRALYIARSLGFEAYGVSADKHSYKGIEKNRLREIPADIKAFLDVSFHIKPKFLGEPIPITGDSKKSWEVPN